MLKNASQHIRTAITLLIVLMILTGGIYPTLVTGIAQSLFSEKANGSLIESRGHRVGSLFIGQSFSGMKYFWGRPSATTPFPYNAENSSGSNLGPSNPILFNAIKDRINRLKKADPKNTDAIPVDLVTASGSGLDPEISPLAAFYQVPRVAKARGLSESVVQALVQSLITPRYFGILGEPSVNVLALNLALDNLLQSKTR